MAFFQLMMKANRLEKARLTYQDEKLRSIEISRGAKVHYTLSQRIRRRRIIVMVSRTFLPNYKSDGQQFLSVAKGTLSADYSSLFRVICRFKRKLRNCWKKCTSCPKDSWFHKKSVLLRTEGTFENFILKSIIGFIGGMFLTYVFFMFFVFQLNFTLSSATILCSMFGIVLTIGLAFSYRVRCAVFLLLPQFFSKRGRQALMAYAFILAITGPAKNTLHNIGVLSESLACGQEKLKEAVKSIVDLVKQPFYALREAISKVIKTIKIVVKKIKQALLAIKRMVLSILRVIKAAFQWLGSVVNICNKKLGTPFERCERVFEGAVTDCYAKLGPFFGAVCNLTYIVKTLCYIVKPLDWICELVSFVADTVVGAVRKKIRKFTRHMKAMFYVKIKFSHSFAFETNKSRSLDDVSKGIVTEIRSRTDRFLTVFDWMSFATSFFVLFMLLKVMHYRQKWLTSERYDNKYITKDLRHIDMVRAKSRKETVLPLNPREKNKYIPLSSILLIRVEKRQLMKSAVFLGLTSFKLCIHMIADYSLYWILSTIRYHGRFETKVQRTNAVGVYVSGNGYLADLYRSIVRAFSPMGMDMEMDSVPCLPDPVPPDLDRYTQIIMLIVISWIMAIFEPYGLRLRSVVMTYYHPMRAQQRAVWLYNHIIRSRGSFLKYARRQLRRKFGMNNGRAPDHVTFKERMFAIFPILNRFFHMNERMCLLCGTVERDNEPPHVKCPTPGCVGLFCIQCFADLQNLCTVCLAPMDYGDLSDMSEEKDSSDDQLLATRGRLKKIRPKMETIVSGTESVGEDFGETEKLITKDAKLSRDESVQMTEETGDVSSSTEYSQSYQDEEPEEMDLTKEPRAHYKDVEAQKLHDDVTIQIFNEPLRGDGTSGDGSPTSCFVVRAHRRLRSRLKRKYPTSASDDGSSSSSTSSIADSESLSTEEIEEEEIIHVEIEDDSEEGNLGAGGSKILTKKRGRFDKIVGALSKVSWINGNSQRNKDRQENSEQLEKQGPTLMNKVLDMLQAKRPRKSTRSYKNRRESMSDGYSYSSSSGSSMDDDYENRALLKRTSRNSRDVTSKGKRGKSLSRKKPRNRSREYRDDYIYETSWDSHRQRGGGETTRFATVPKYDEDRYKRRVRAMSKGTKYSEINEINFNKLSDGKSSSETGKTEESWNITETEDKQATTSDYSHNSRGNANEINAHSLGMSTIEEDSKELSTTDNQTDNEVRTYENETDGYIDVTGFSNMTSDTSREKTPRKKKNTAKYVTKEEIEAATPEGRKRSKSLVKRRLQERYDSPELYDPMAGLEIYGVRDKRRNKKRQAWVEEETTEMDEEKIEKSGEEDKSGEEAKSGEQENLKEIDTSTETNNELKKVDTTTETSGTERQSSNRRKLIVNDGNYQEHHVRVKRLKKEKCRKHGKKGKRSKHRKKRERSKDNGRMAESSKQRRNEISPNWRTQENHERRKYDGKMSETSKQQQTEISGNCRIQANPEEWFYEEQRRIWEQMCTKMAEYSHSFGCPDRNCRPAPYFPHAGCTIPMYNPTLFRPPTQGHSCPRFPRGPRNFNDGQRPVPPVLKRFLPKYQKSDMMDELKSHDRARLTRERNERRRKCDCGQVTTLERDRESFSRKILSRPSIILERTDVLPYQETESFKDLVNEYKTITIPRKIDEDPEENEYDEEFHDTTDDREPLISLSKNADTSKDVKQLFPPESKRRPSAMAQLGTRIASVFKANPWKKSKDVIVDQNIADTESWTEMSTIDEDKRVKSTVELTSAEETTDNNETTE